MIVKKMRAAMPALLIALGLLFTAACGEKDPLERIRESGEITVITRNNAHCYYIYRDNPMGFEYDLAKAFSDHLGVKLKVITPAWDELIDRLNAKEGDFIAASLTVTPSRGERVAFSEEYLSVQQKLILHVNNRNIKKPEDLRGKIVHVRRGTSYEERLREMREEGLEVAVRVHDDVPTEELIEMVAGREIEATVADSNVALLNRRYYPDVKIAFPIEEPQSLGWAVRKGERRLLEEINRFFRKIRDEGTFAKIYQKYYASVEIFDYLDLKKYHRRLENRLPRYKDMIREAANRHGFDWRLIAAMVYQESHFDPDAESPTGVKGLMQLTESAASDMGVEDRLDPRQSIMGGVRYLKRLYKRHEDAGRPDRLLISLAAYNVGQGHIRDAQRLAEEMNLDPNSWSALKQILPLLRHPKYYKRTRHGYCRGTEPVRYVNRILTYFDILRRDDIQLQAEEKRPGAS